MKSNTYFSSMKRFTAFIIAVIVAFTLVVPAFASDEVIVDESMTEPVEYSADAALASASGDAPTPETSDIQCSFSNGVLTIWGSGVVDLDPVIGDAPWAAYSDQIISVMVADGITGIGRYAFYGCTSLESITFADSVTSIESGAFAGCESLTAIDIPASVSFISSSAFESCCNLAAINVDSSNSEYSSINGVLYSKDASSLILCPQGKGGSFAVPEGVTTIGYGAFAQCSGITAITLPSTLTEIEEGAFLDCASISSIIIPESVEAISDIAFQGCTSLKNVNISAGVTGIHAAAFNGCSALETIKIPSSVTFIGDNAFYGCGSFTVEFMGDQDQWDSINVRMKYNTELENANIIIGSCDHVIQTIKGYAATCTTTGLTDGKKCIVCERMIVEQTVIPVKGHTMEATAAKAATCDTPGNKAYYTCTTCGKLYLDVNGKTETTLAAVTIAAGSHKLNAVAAKASTCTTAGNKAYWECTLCGKLFLDSNAKTQTTANSVLIYPLGHDMSYTAHQYSTCEGTGNEAYWTCGNCHNMYSDYDGKNPITLAEVTIAPRGHSLYMVGEKAATETTDGNIVYWACSQCDNVYLDAEGKNKTTLANVIIPSQGHTLVSVAAKAATCSEPGNYQYYVCTGCYRLYSDKDGKNPTTQAAVTIPAKGHNMTAVAAKAVTCTTNGNLAYWICGNCQGYFLDAEGQEETTKDEVILQKTGHNLIGTAAKSATCESEGNMAYWTCTNCGKNYLDSNGSTYVILSQIKYAAKGHSLTRTAGKAATCTTAGNKEYWTCSTCSKVFLDAAGTVETTREDVKLPATGHSLTATPEVPASCGVKGNKAYWTCDNCGRIFLDENAVNETTLAAVSISAKKHSLKTVMSTSATCESEGNKTYWVCSTCNKLFADSSAKNETTVEAVIIPAKGHSMARVAAKAATCTTAGNKEYWKCSTCNKYFLDSEGTKTTTANDVTIPAIGHNMTATEAKAATCTGVGNVAYWSCGNCGKIFFDSKGNSETTINSVLIAAKGHSMTATPAKAASCSEPGNKAYWTCNVCDGVFADAEGTVPTGSAEYTIKALGHNLVATAAKAATETASGNLAYWTCKTCSKIFADAKGETETTLSEVTIPAKGHTHSYSMVAAKEATCTSDGNIAYWVCTSCYKLYTDVSGNNEITSADVVIPAKGHSTVKTEAVAATCLTAGHKAYWTCSDCGKMFVDEEGKTETNAQEIIISATGHDLIATAAKVATCTEGGHKAYWTCRSCGEFFLDAKGTQLTDSDGILIPAKGHSLVETKEKKATCTTAGHKAYWTCSTCGNMFLDSEGKTKTNAASVVIPATGHIMEESPATEATCTDEGNLHFWKCPVCSKMFLDEAATKTTNAAAVVVPAKGHNMTATPAKAATCTSDGNKAYWTCQDCHNIYLDENGNTITSAYGVILQATGHTIVQVDGKEATETETGIKIHYECQSCGKLFEDPAGYKETTIENITIPVINHVHEFTRTYAVPASCTHDGNITYWTCNSCGKMYLDNTATSEVTPSEVVVHAKGHEMTLHEATAATCTTGGYRDYYQCKYCGKFYEDLEGTTELTSSEIKIAAAGHKLKYVEAKAATCTEGGTMRYWECEVCGNAYLDENGSTKVSTSQLSTKAKGHSWDGGKVTKEATYTSKGIKTYTCANCGLTKTEEIDTLLINQANGLGNSAAPDGNWYYVINKRVDTSYTGVINNNNGWWYVENGKVNFSYTGFARNANGDWYIKGGKVDFSKKDVMYGTVEGVSAWWNVEGGKVKYKETVASNSSGWWYIGKDGKVDFSFKGFASNSAGVWYLEGGRVSFSVTDVINGTVNGVSGWWNVEGSQVKYKETVAKNSNGWWYIGKDGKVNFNFTGIASNSKGSWYCKDGKVQFGYTGTVWYNGKSYRISGGKVY